MQKAELIVRELPYTVNEELKYLRTNIQFCGAEKKVILFTSSLAGEGKSTLILRLGKSLCELGKNVLLVDADLRRSKLQYEVKDPAQVRYGLSHYLSGMVPLNDALTETDNPRLYVLFAGQVPPNPSELLSGKRVDTLLSWAREQFDYVLIDTAPLGAVIDAAVLAPKCDGSVIVIEAGRVPYRTVQNVARQLTDAGRPILGAVLNKAASRSGKKYYSHYDYGYSPELPKT